MSVETIGRCDKCYRIIEEDNNYGELKLRILNKKELINVDALDLCNGCLREAIRWISTNRKIN